MSDPLTWSISLGRWAGVQVRIHALLILFVIFSLLESTWTREDPGLQIRVTISWLLLLCLVVGLHVLAQAVVAARLGADLDEVRIWPLGNLVGPEPMSPRRSMETALVSIAGLAMSCALALVAAIGLGLARARMTFNPFGNAKLGGAPWILGAPGLPAAPTWWSEWFGPVSAPPFSAVWWVGWFGYLNWVLFLANLIPALPLAGGRIYRATLAGRSRDHLIAPHTARTCAVVLGAWGLIRWLFIRGAGGPELIGLALLIEMMVRHEARMLEERGFFEDGVFGYDFSDEYASSETSAAATRPIREGALKRWRRRRSELRRMRREAQEAAEEARVDEILEKLHREGRNALTDDERGFLVRVSTRYKNRSSHNG